MTTKRTPLRRDARARITPELVALWLKLKEITGAGAHEKLEPDGRRVEYLDALHALDRLLGMKPWQVCPLDAVTAEPPSHLQQHRLDSWRRAWELRRALEAASKRR